MSDLPVIAILSPGDMGSGVGRALGEHGYRVVTSLAGRSENSRKLAGQAGIEDLGSLEAVVSTAELILSILPPDQAKNQAEAVMRAMKDSGSMPAYADCNAISPDSSKAIAQLFDDPQMRYIDAGIIGLAPGKGPATRFYASGPDTRLMERLDGAGIEVKPLGSEIGRASAMKMVYAAMTKGQMTLLAAVWTLAEILGLRDELLSEWEFSQPDMLARARRIVPRLPADSARWVGEMEEIATTFRRAGLSGAFHDGAADIFRLLSQTPFAEETRASMDQNRSLEEAIAVYAKFAGKKEGN